jgi:hypothetical protein
MLVREDPLNKTMMMELERGIDDVDFGGVMIDK